MLGQSMVVCARIQRITMREWGSRAKGELRCAVQWYRVVWHGTGWRGMTMHTEDDVCQCITATPSPAVCCQLWLGGVCMCVPRVA
jgi:hypothetical protein